MDLYEGKTQFQGDTLTKGYVGQRIVIKCYVQDVVAEADFIVVAAKDADKKLIIANFKTADAEPIKLLPPGSQIEISGEIHVISTLMITLRECQAVAADAAKPLTHS
jgi:hypothetical protein